MKIEIRSGYEGIGGYYMLEKEYSIEMEKYCEKDILKKVLLNEFESEEGVVEYWKGIDCDLNSVEDVIEYIVYDKEEMEKMGLFEGKWMIGEEIVCEFNREEEVE